MLIASIPYKFTHVWGANAASGFVTSPIPDTASGGAASQQVGFPPLNATPIGAGGIPPSVEDQNGALQYATAWIQWMQAGAPIPYDATFSGNIGGYPNGAIIASAVTPGLRWQSTVDNNTTNPDASGAGWVAYPVAPPIVGFQTVVNTTQSVIVPDGVANAEIWVTAAGGNGSSCFTSTGVAGDASGAGGGSGGTCIGIIAVTPGDSILVTVGTNAGSRGSSFGVLTASGGADAGFTAVTVCAGGAPGVASGGSLNLPGAPGSDGQNGPFIFAGNGAPSFWGGGGRAGAHGGANATVPGAGGGGAYDSANSGVTYAGGTGADGVVVINWRS